MNIRAPKVRITDNRQPRAGAPSPLERPTSATRGGSMTGLEYLSASQQREIAEHDRAVRDYDAETLAAAYDDLDSRSAWNRKDPEHRWIMARKAALLRRGAQMRKAGLA